MKKIALIGIGNCGGQVAQVGESKYGQLMDSIYINTSKSDLSMISGNGPQIKIGGDGEIEGSGKNRNKMKEYLQSDIKNIITNEDIINIISGKKYVFVISSAAGGTGSGAAPVMLEILKRRFPETHFILVMVLPTISSSMLEQSNCVEYLKELYSSIGKTATYMVYDNETVSSKSATDGLAYVNEQIIEDIRIISGIDNLSTPFESIDDADMESIVTTPGRLLITRVNKGLSEKAFEDGDVDDIIIKSIKSSSHAETDRNKEVKRWGVITYFTEAVNSLYSNRLTKVSDFIGTPVERFNHNAINDKSENLNFMYLIASGLSPINDRTRRITDRMDELDDLMKSDNSSNYLLDVADKYNKSEMRKSEEVTEPTAFNVNDIFDQFK